MTMGLQEHRCSPGERPLPEGRAHKGRRGRGGWGLGGRRARFYQRRARSSVGLTGVWGEVRQDGQAEGLGLNLERPLKDVSRGTQSDLPFEKSLLAAVWGLD